MIDRLPCPIPGCSRSRTDPNQHFSSKSTLLHHLNHEDNQATFYLADQSICTVVDIYSCTQHSYPTAPTRFFRSLNELTLHNALHHPPPPIHSPSTTDQPSPTSTNTLHIRHPSSTQTARMGLTTCGISASPSSYKTPITTHPTSKTHDADTSNTATIQTFSAYKPTLFKQSPT
jgi:hypothetical protein